MDIKIDNKDIALKDNGMPVVIVGIEQVLQQLQIASNVEKGSFIYDRELGLEITEEIMESVNRDKTIETLLNELLIEVPNVTVTVKSVNVESSKKTVTVTVTDGYKSMETEVIIYENI